MTDRAAGSAAVPEIWEVLSVVTALQVRKVVEPCGFVVHDEPGFVGFHRTRADGVYQELHVFWWANATVAAQRSIPRAYLVVCPTLVAEKGRRSTDWRFILPLVDWPSAGQPTRRWDDVADEFERVFLAAFDAPGDEGPNALLSLGERYELR